jgi:protein SCO1/2
VFRIFLVVAIALAGSSCSRGPALPNFGVVPDFKLTSQTGQPFESRTQLNGKVWIADFIFTNCMGPCPRMTSQMKQVRDALADAPDLRLASFTVDPARDTPEVLNAYSQRFKADPANWFFLTGAQAELDSLFRKTFMLGNVDGSLEHSTRFALVDRKSRIRGFYDTSDQANIAKLIEDARRLLKDSA